MKGNKFILILAMAVIAAILAASPLLAKGEPSAKVSFLTGKALFKKGATGKWTPLKAGATLGADYIIKTEKTGKIELTLPDGSLLRVAPASRIRLKSLLFKGKKKKSDTKFKVTAGKIWANVSKALGNEKKFEVTTDNAVAGVRGTVFMVDALEDKSTVIKVFSGAVAVSNAPIYQKEAPSPGGKRTQVPGPAQISKKQWEEMIAKTMKQVRVGADGRMAMSDIDEKSAAEDEWIAWNTERDKASGIKH